MMSKYNSVYTVSITIDHDKEDASDIDREDILERLRCIDYLIIEGPDNTIKNE